MKGRGEIEIVGIGVVRRGNMFGSSLLGGVLCSMFGGCLLRYMLRSFLGYMLRGLLCDMLRGLQACPSRQLGGIFADSFVRHIA